MARRQFPDRNERGAPIGASGAGIARQGLAAAVGAIAFLCYYATLLPGLDLGDSASFQTIAGSLTLTPRQAYPLYYALGNAAVWLHPGEAARAMNLLSAALGALGAGGATIAGVRLTGSLAGGAVAGLMLAFSYTFWSQAVTAEVYTLHVLLTALGITALLEWAERPTPLRLAIFYGLVALSFGNHLSTVLLLPGYTAFLLMKRSPGPTDPLRARTIAMACGIAALGTLQYGWNFRGMWAELEPPASLLQGARSFWFDVTKADWRETLVFSVSEAGLQHRPSMYWFDLRQQFGLAGIVLAAAGGIYLLATRFQQFMLVALLFAVNLAFAWTYNVGDAYIFFLPSHFIVALCGGAGAAAVMALASRLRSRAAACVTATLLVLQPVWRGYDTFPAVDRSDDHRAVELLGDMTSAVGSAAAAGRTIYGLDANWQVQNAVEYFMREHKPAVPWFTSLDLDWLDEGDRATDWHRFVAANHEIGRGVVITETLRKTLEQTEPSVLPVQHAGDDVFVTAVRSTLQGTPYALGILMPDREYSIDTAAIHRAWAHLAGSGVALPPPGRYTIVVGHVGSPPLMMQSGERPFRARTHIDDLAVDARMESWLPTDTIRRAGFGHVIVNGRHALTLERGVSFAPLRARTRAVYLSGLFARPQRYVVSVEGEVSPRRVIVDRQ